MSNVSLKERSVSVFRQPQITSIGIDVSKRELVVGARTTDGVLTPRVFPNSRIGATQLASFLTQQETAHTVPCIIESTGDFHLLSSFILTEAGYNVKCINPILTKQYQRSSVRNAKSDSIDATRLAEIGEREPALPSFEANMERLATKKALASCALLENTVQKMKRHIQQTRATARELGFVIDLSNADEGIRCIQKQIALLTEVVTAQRSERALILSKKIPGLTDRKMAVVDAHLMGHSFLNRDQLVAFTGLDVMTRTSGSWRGREHISKRGNAYLRKTLYQIAWGLSRHSPVFKAYYQRLRARKKHYTTCLMAVARKFLRFIYAWYYGSLRFSTEVNLT